MDDMNLFWTAFGAIGGTLGALATTAAVIVSLWQTKIAYKKKLKISFSDNSAIPVKDKLVQVVTFNISNVGNKDVVLSGLKLTQKEGYDLVILPPYLKYKTIEFPNELKQEHSATLVMEMNDFIANYNEIVEKMPKLRNKKIKIVVTDSVGHNYYLKLKKTPDYYLSKNGGQV